MAGASLAALGEAADLVSRAIRESDFAELVSVREETLRISSAPDGSILEDLSVRERILVKARVRGSWLSATLPASTLPGLLESLSEATPSAEAERLILPRMGRGVEFGNFSPEEDAGYLWEVVTALAGGPDSLSASCTLRSISVRNSLGVGAETSEIETAVVAFWHSSENWFRPADEEVLGGWARPRDLVRSLVEGAESVRSAREEGRGGLRIVDPPRGAPIALAPRAAGTLVHELLQHGLEGDAVAGGRSYLSGMLGGRVAPELLTVRSGPPHPGWRVDHEGVAVEEAKLVSEGVVTSYLTDVESAIRLGLPPIGCGRSAGDDPPSPRATALSVEPVDGGPDLDEMASEFETLLLVDRASGGSTDPSSGEFRISAPSALVLRRGYPTGVTPAIWLEGSCASVLRGLLGLGGRSEEFVTLCAKGGGTVLTRISSPPAAISGEVVRVVLA